MAETLIQEAVGECGYCGDEFDSDPEQRTTDPAGETICWTCYSDTFEYDCCKCGEYDHIDNQHKLVVVFDEEGAGVPTGIYKVLKTPYYMAGMIGSGWLFNDSLQHLGDVPVGADGEGYPVGHLCSDCQKLYGGVE